MAEYSEAREIIRYGKYAIYRVFKKFFYCFLPSYRLGKKNEQILTHIYLMLQDLRRENMPLDTGERLVPENLDKIEQDHLKRYEFAKTLIKDGDNVLDIACGVGYGSYLMGENSKVKITGVDISTGAIEHASKHFKKDNIEFICSRAEVFQPKKEFDVIVSFESIEHIEDDKGFIESITKHLKKGGLFVCSTPNETTNPHSILKATFHYRHYTIRQMNKILIKKGGLKIEEIYTQRRSQDYELSKSPLGIYTVHVARKI